MKPKYLLASLLIGSLLASCEKDKDNPVIGGGAGGTTTFIVTPKHHSRVIEDCMVYITYGDTTGIKNHFDDSVRCITVNGQTMAVFGALRPGNYYFFGRGFDPKINEEVSGGTGISIKSNAYYPVSLPVTESAGHND